MAEKKAAEKAENKPEIKEEKKPETVVVKIPRERKDQEDKVVWVNAHRYVIKRGVPVEVPVSVAKVLDHEQRMLDKIMAFEDAHAN